MIRDQQKVPSGYLWEKEDKGGKTYWAGVISIGVFGEIPIVVFKEDRKTNEAAPDYVIRNATERKRDSKDD